MKAFLKNGALKGLVVLCVLVCTGGLVYAEGLLPSDIEISSTLDFYSDYVWRGFTLDRDPVIQPGVSISAKGFTYSFWGSWDMDNNEGGQSDEIDQVLDYTVGLTDVISISLGHTFYDFPDSNTYSKEFYLGVGLTKIPVIDFPLGTSLTYYRDYGDQNNGGGLGSYLSLDSSYGYVLFEDLGVTLDLGVHFGYNRKLFISGTSGYDAGVTLGLTLPLKDNLTMSPTISYAVPLADLEERSDGNQDERFYTGVSLAYSF